MCLFLINLFCFVQGFAPKLTLNTSLKPLKIINSKTQITQPEWRVIPELTV